MSTHRPLDLTLISAKDLKDVNLVSKMEVYAVVTLSGDPRSKQRTPTDRENSKNPNWNATLRFYIPDHAGDQVLHVLLRCERALGDRDVGEVNIPVKELGLDGGKAAKFVSYQVRTTCGKSKPKGVLNISYKFEDSVAAAVAPPMGMAAPPPVGYPPMSSSYGTTEKPAYPSYPQSAYPPPSQSSAATAYPPPSQSSVPTAYPPPPQPSGATPYPPPAGYPGYGAPPPAGYPPAHGYGAPPPPGAYGYPGYGAPPPVVQPQKPAKKNKFGLGLGAGLLGGALGGLLIGEAISDVGAYDAGYDAGFDDGGGFDGGFDF